MKKIIITTEGYIESKKVYGPVLSPYMETSKEIMKMLARGVKVLEVLPDGEHKALSVSDLREAVTEHRNYEVRTTVKESRAIVTPKENEKQKQATISKKDKKKDKKNQNKQQELGFEIDVLESK